MLKISPILLYIRIKKEYIKYKGKEEIEKYMFLQVMVYNKGMWYMFAGYSLHVKGSINGSQ